MDFLLLNLDVIIYILTFVQLCDRDSLMIAAPNFFTLSVMKRVDELMKREFQKAFKTLEIFGKITGCVLVNKMVICDYGRFSFYKLFKTYFNGEGKFSHIKLTGNYDKLKNLSVDSGLECIEIKEDSWYLNHKYHIVDDVKYNSYFSVVTQGKKKNSLKKLYGLAKYGFRTIPDDHSIECLLDFKNFGKTKIYLHSSCAKKFITKLLSFHCFGQFSEFFNKYSLFEYSDNVILIDSLKKFSDFRLAFIEGCPSDRLEEFIGTYELENHYEMMVLEHEDLDFWSFLRNFFELN